MRKRLIAVLLVILLTPSLALASRQYIIPDSDTRALTSDELWEWNYTSLGYILNEIFARHGYNFTPGGKYDNFFSARPWYTPNSDANNSAACYPKLSSLEWSNERLVKDVRADMRAQGTANPGGKNYLDYVSTDDFDVLSGFALISLKAGQKLAVYSAPSDDSYRGANGKALVSTNGTVYAAGWVNNWLLVMYQTNKGAVRVGYVNGDVVQGSVSLSRKLDFAYLTIILAQNATLTDDPVTGSTSIARMDAGQTVTYLSSFQNRKSWAYVEVSVNGQMARGFIPENALKASDSADENENAGM